MQSLDRLVPGGASTWGATAFAEILVDSSEHDRRATCGLGALDRVAINAMFSLPCGYWVRWEDIGDGLARVLRSCADGLVECSEYGVRRLVVPPVTVTLAVVTGVPWTTGLRTAGAFAPFCRRVLLLAPPRRVPMTKLWEADYSGVGVWVQTGDGVEQLVAPAPWQQLYFKPAGWEFRERAYDAWLIAAGCRPLGGPPDLFGSGWLQELGGC